MKNFWDNEFMKTLSIFEGQSKCVARKVCCIIVKNNNILSIGLNGSISGSMNCNDLYLKEDGVWYRRALNKYEEDDLKYTYPTDYYEPIIKNGITYYCVDYMDDFNIYSHHFWSEQHEVHAEMNAIKKATVDGHYDISDSTFYISSFPCFNCAKQIVLYGVKRVVYREPYDKQDSTYTMLLDNNIEIINIK